MEVDALLDAGAAVVSWLNRGTLHLIAAEDYGWLHEPTAPQLATANRRRLAQEGVTPAMCERGVEAVARALAERGPGTRAELRVELERAGVRFPGQGLVEPFGELAETEREALDRDWADVERFLTA